MDWGATGKRNVWPAGAVACAPPGTTWSLKLGNREAEADVRGRGPGELGGTGRAFPFVGAAGQFWTKCFPSSMWTGSAATSPTSSNAARPRTGTPWKRSRRPAGPFLEAQIQLVQPKILGVPGPHRRPEAHPGPITASPGAWPLGSRRDGVWMTAFYHPSAYCGT